MVPLGFCRRLASALPSPSELRAESARRSGRAPGRDTTCRAPPPRTETALLFGKHDAEIPVHGPIITPRLRGKLYPSVPYQRSSRGGKLYTAVPREGDVKLSVFLCLTAAAFRTDAGRDRQRRHRRRGHQRQGPEGGRLGHRRDHRPADQIRQNRRHRRPRPLPASRPAEGATTTSGCAATGWSIPPKVQATPGQDARTSRPSSRPTPRPRRNTIRPATGTRCFSVPTKANSPAPARAATASRPT